MRISLRVRTSKCVETRLNDAWSSRTGRGWTAAMVTTVISSFQPDSGSDTSLGIDQMLDLQGFTRGQVIYHCIWSKYGRYPETPRHYI
ncbi:hypothetical protein DPEC_G00264970, partial [Dallia pectoralis]